jgi:flavin reductase (DIM6/NTAB) family NADH-FMN oxidoreductase RutF
MPRPYRPPVPRMRLDFAALGAAEAYRWMTATVTPRPIAWVSTRSADGIDNLAPFSFFQVVCDDPPTLMLSIGARADGGEKDTLRNLRERGEMVIQLVSMAQADAMSATAAGFPHGVSEFERCGVASTPSERVAPVRVADAAVAFECALASIQPYPARPSPAKPPSHHLVFAEVLLAHIDDAVLGDARHVDPARLDVVGRLGGSAYATTRDVFHVKRRG